MTPDQFIDLLTKHYQNARSATPGYHSQVIQRGRQHNIASIAEDLFAYFLHQNLIEAFPGLRFHVDFGMVPGWKGEKLYPDVAIIDTHTTFPRIVSYLDLKTDLGYKRDFFKTLPGIKSKVERLRQADHAGFSLFDNRLVKISPDLVWRTVVISDQNMSRDFLSQNIEAAALYSDVFKLYFLSGGLHPNAKSREHTIVYQDVFSTLLDDIRNDIQRNL